MTVIGAEDPSIPYTDRLTVKVLIFNDLGDVLIINDGLLPGGGVDDGEDAIAALHREAMEELGIKIDTIQALTEIIQYRDFLQKKYIIQGYTASYVSSEGKARPQDEGEARFTYKWYSPQEAIRLLDDSIRHVEMKPVEANDTYQGKLLNLRTTKLFLQAYTEVYDLDRDR